MGDLVNQSSSNFISLPDAREMVQTYIRKHEQEPGFTRAVHFQLKDLKDLIDKTEASGCDGIRIYFGEYTENQVKEFELPEAYQDRSTLVLVSTKGNKDFFSTKNDNGCLGDGSELENPPFNRGIICPPDSGCDDGSPILKP